ncbi:hypothetical protein ACEPAG_8477 [Sanghuangporus baumii]
MAMAIRRISKSIRSGLGLNDTTENSSPTLSFSVQGNSSAVKRRPWFRTTPIEEAVLSKRGSPIHLEVKARHQGWVEAWQQDKSQSWFELKIIREDVKVRDEKKPQERERDENKAKENSEKKPEPQETNPDDKKSQETNPDDKKSQENEQVDKKAKIRQDGKEDEQKNKLQWRIVDVPVENDGTPTKYQGNLKGEDLKQFWDNLKRGDRLEVIGCARYTGWNCFGRWAELRVGAEDAGASSSRTNSKT